jgi:hypothetical protein
VCRCVLIEMAVGSSRLQKHMRTCHKIPVPTTNIIWHQKSDMTRFYLGGIGARKKGTRREMRPRGPKGDQGDESRQLGTKGRPYC